MSSALRADFCQPNIIGVPIEIRQYKQALSELARSKDARVRQKIAEQSHTPSSVLEWLAGDENELVRLAAAENSNISHSALLNLTRDPSDDVRYALAENHSLPTSVLMALAADDNPYVSCRAEKTLQRCGVRLS